MTRYRMFVQMFGTYEVDADLVDALNAVFDFGDNYDYTDHSFLFEFNSILKLREIKQKVKSFLVSNQRVYYFDVTYIHDDDFVPDRWVAWRDGRELSYTGSVEFTENNWDEMGGEQ